MASKQSRFSFALAGAAVTGGIFIGWIDTHNDEASATVLALAVLSLALGWFGSRRPWLWAVLAGIWVPALSWVLPPAGLAPWNPGLPRTAPSYLALTAVVMATCFAAAYAGAWLGRTVQRNLRRQAESSPRNR